MHLVFMLYQAVINKFRKIPTKGSNCASFNLLVVTTEYPDTGDNFKSKYLIEVHAKEEFNLCEHTFTDDLINKIMALAKPMQLRNYLRKEL